MRRQLTSYLPMQEVLRQWSDRIKHLTIPLFPNYLFVHIPARDRARVLEVAGVARFVSLAGQPATISDEEIEMIRKLEAARAEPEPQFSLLTGDRVRVTAGPFAGQEGVLFRRLGKARFGLRLDGLRQAMSLEICESMLQKL